MSLAEMLLPEFDQEMARTRRVLERVPEDKLDWKPHPKSNTIGWNANHLAEIAGWAVGALTTPSLDVAPPGGPKYQSPKFTKRAEIHHTIHHRAILCVYLRLNDIPVPAIYGPSGDEQPSMS